MGGHSNETEKQASHVQIQRIARGHTERREMPSGEACVACTVLHSDILVLVFALLDATALLRAARTCRHWAHLIADHATLLWRIRCVVDFRRCPPQAIAPLQFYKLHANVYHGSYLYADFPHSAEISCLSVPARPDSPVSRTTGYVTVWPTSPGTTLLCMVDDYIAWVNNSLLCTVSVVKLCHGGLPDLSTIRTFDFSHPVQLVLGSETGLLASFDESSLIKVWDARSDFDLVFNLQLDRILTFNVHKNLVAVCSETGKITVWDTRTKSQKVTYTLPTPPNLGSQEFVNIAMWDNVLIYGCSNGSFYTLDINSGICKLSFNVFESMNLQVQKFDPMTVSVTGTVVVTNGPQNLLAWDYTTGKLLYDLSTENAGKRHAMSGEHVPSFESLKLAEVTKDGSLICGCVVEDGVERLTVWDFSKERKGRRVFERRAIMDGHGVDDDLEFWVCFDE